MSPRVRTILLCGVAMSLGWGMRGFIGGGPFGAMIPGAMVTLLICHFHGIGGDRATVAAAFGAVGIGIGGEMTYGQTVGYAMAPATMWWGIFGLSLKGAIWGLVGGALLEYGLEGPTPAKTAGLAGILIAATTIGWKLVNNPKWIYFSNPVDRPREEVWCGFLLAGLAACVYLWRWRFAAAGFLFGGLGFGLGGLVQHWGRNYSGVPRLDWWKGMEFTFGFLFGVGLAWAAQAVRPGGRGGPQDDGLWKEVAIGVAAAAALYFADPLVPLRFAYLALGAVALWAVSNRPGVALQLALTTTYMAFVDDLYGEGAAIGPVRVAGLLTSVVMAWAVASARRSEAFVWRAFLLITWTGVAVAILKALSLARGGWEPWLTYGAFVAMAAVVHRLAAPPAGDVSEA
ncbi:MAG: hypothetical protein R2729_31340 [Bryobacteraceae bacterium]